MLNSIVNSNFVFYLPTQSKKLSTDKAYFIKLWNIAISVRFFLSIVLSSLSIIIACLFFKNHAVLWSLSLAMLLPKIINPSLFLHALERNKSNFNIGLFSKILFLISVLLIQNSLYINLFLGISELIVLLFFYKQIDISFSQIKLPSFNTLFRFVKDTFSFFLLNLFSLLRPTSVLPAISFFIGNEFVTLYVLAEKIMNAIRGISGVLFISFFPIYNKEKINLSNITFNTILKTILISCVTVLIMWFFSPFIIYLLNNFETNKLAAKTLQILALSIPMHFMIVPLFSYLLDSNKQVLLASIAFVILLITLISFSLFHVSIIQIAIGYVVSEYMLLIGYLFFIILYKKTTKIS